MKKEKLLKNKAIIGIICIVALFISLAYQFIPCWTYTGIVKNSTTGEMHVEKMEMALAEYVWLPFTQEADAFESYLKDPTLGYAEKASTISYTEEEFTDMTLKLEALENQEEAAAEEETTAEETSTETTDETAAETTTETTADAATETAAETAAETTITGEKRIEGAVYTYAVTTAEIAEYNTDITDASHKTVISASANGVEKAKKYTEYSKIIEQDSIKFLNDMVIASVLLLLLAGFGIFFVIRALKKGEVKFVASVFTLVVGALNLLNLFIQPIFLVSQAKSFNTMLIVFGAVTLWGLVILVKDIIENAKKAKNAEA